MITLCTNDMDNALPNEYLGQIKHWIVSWQYMDDGSV